MDFTSIFHHSFKFLPKMVPYSSQFVCFLFLFIFGIVDGSILPQQQLDFVDLASPDAKFTVCCHKKTKLKEQTVKDACHYPPNKMEMDEQLDIAANFEHYIGCYAAHKNNRECCKKAGLVDQYKDCQDLCDGANPPKLPDYKYLICTRDVSPDISLHIAGCNKDGWGQGESNANNNNNSNNNNTKMLRHLLLAKLADDLKSFRMEDGQPGGMEEA